MLRVCTLVPFIKVHQGLIDPRSGERACNSAYACRDGKVLVVTKNRTLPFSKACPNPPQNLWQKLRPKFKQTDALKLLWQLLANVLFAGTYGYWQQMKI